MQRRTLLSGVGAIGTVALAGCSGGGNEGSDGNTQASGGACPSLPLSYTEKRVDKSPKVALEVPSAATFTVDGVEGTPGATVKVGSEQISRSANDWTLTVQTGTTSVSNLETMETDQKFGEELTSEYDLSMEGSRVFKDIMDSTLRIVFLATNSDPIRIRVSAANKAESICTEAALEAQRRVIETVRPVE